MQRLEACQRRPSGRIRLIPTDSDGQVRRLRVDSRLAARVGRQVGGKSERVAGGQVGGVYRVAVVNTGVRSRRLQAGKTAGRTQNRRIRRALKRGSRRCRARCSRCGPPGDWTSSRAGALKALGAGRPGLGRHTSSLGRQDSNRIFPRPESRPHHQCQPLSTPPTKFRHFPYEIHHFSSHSPFYRHTAFSHQPTLPSEPSSWSCEPSTCPHDPP
jgi:hypothetical protein